MSLTQQGGPVDLVFVDRATRSLPVDPDETNRTRQVHGAAFSRVRPQAFPDPGLVAYSAEVAADLGLPEQACSTPDFAAVFSGQRVLTGMDPHASCYGGHQFGNWAGQLGDGRAINLGEVVGVDGAHRMLQLKGAGPTPYSRSGDGYAVLRSSVREFLCSEAMHHLGIPTTRALSLVRTGAEVMRDMFYDGHARLEPGAVVCRVSASFTRFGTFELPAARGDVALLKTLVDHSLRCDFSQLGEPSPEAYLHWFEEVSRRTSALIVHWMRVGFVHGVMNTDNMSILGQTIDYGPYGWLEDYDPNWTPNTTDASGRRYRFANQAQVAHWNLLQLGNAIASLVPEVEALQAVVDAFPRDYEAKWSAMMGAKLGLAKWRGEQDQQLALELLEILQLAETDMTLFFRGLARVPASEEQGSAPSNELPPSLLTAYYVEEQLTPEVRQRTVAWLARYGARLRTDGLSSDARRAQMDAVNPKYVLRNYLAQLAIDRAEEGDDALISQLLELLRRPYDEQPEHEHFAQKRPDWARERPGCSMLSCSS